MPKFQKGNPGGPGRPKGSRNVANVILDQLATEGAEKMVRKMIEIATNGDRVAARLVLSRIWAAPKARAVPIELPEINKPEDLVAAHAMVVAALSAGTLTTDEAPPYPRCWKRTAVPSSWWRRKARSRGSKRRCAASRPISSESEGAHPGT